MRAEVETHDHFAVYVTYEGYQVRLILNNSKNCCVQIDGDRGICEEIDAGDIFVENMRNFVTAAREKQVTKDTTELTEHVRVILAVKDAIANKKEIERMKR